MAEVVSFTTGKQGSGLFSVKTRAWSLSLSFLLHPRLTAPGHCNAGQFSTTVCPRKRWYKKQSAAVVSFFAMKQFTCPVCKRQEPCTYEGEKKKPTIHLNVHWQGLPITVTSSGKQCYPCPRCELDENGESRIRTWTQAKLRIHKRLRQNFTRHHHGKLADFYTPEEIVKFYDDARRLRCELIHGPDIDQREEPPTNLSKAESPEPPPRKEGTGSCRHHQSCLGRVLAGTRRER